MAVAVAIEFPAPVEFYDQVSAKLGLDSDPPEGMIIHTGAEADGGMRIFDVWKSAEAFEKFSNERLGPAIGEVAGGDDGPEPTKREIYELHDVFQP
jgi:hypothetical protein